MICLGNILDLELNHVLLAEFYLISHLSYHAYTVIVIICVLLQV